jgi:hypothetical protein
MGSFLTLPVGTDHLVTDYTSATRDIAIASDAPDHTVTAPSRKTLWPSQSPCRARYGSARLAPAGSILTGGSDTFSFVTSRSPPS